MAAYRVGVLPRALADIEKIAKWWRTNRPAAPRLFQDELDLALISIADLPEIGHKPDYAGTRARERTCCDAPATWSSTTSMPIPAWWPSREFVMCDDARSRV